MEVRGSSPGLVKLFPHAFPSLSLSHDSHHKATRYKSKEARTLCEATLSTLLHHPYICTMYKMIIHQHHYYMVFEYVSDVQRLDCIIGHGRFKEQFARKFAQHIGSALDYCHQNNVMHYQCIHNHTVFLCLFCSFWQISRLRVSLYHRRCHTSKLFSQY